MNKKQVHYRAIRLGVNVNVKPLVAEYPMFVNKYRFPKRTPTGQRYFEFSKPQPWFLSTWSLQILIRSGLVLPPLPGTSPTSWSACRRLRGLRRLRLRAALCSSPRTSTRPWARWRPRTPTQRRGVARWGVGFGGCPVWVTFWRFLGWWKGKATANPSISGYRGCLSWHQLKLSTKKWHTRLFNNPHEFVFQTFEATSGPKAKQN